MSINDLDLILKKDPIISTWPARSLRDRPEDVETDYLVHARTHLSLGDTAKYVDTAFKWVSGANKGTFIGAVLGDYGEGKTSFLVHMWDQSRQQQICTVPPFQWGAFEDIADAVAGWVKYILEDRHPELARRVERVHEKSRSRTVEELAKATADESGGDYESVLATVRAMLQARSVQLTEMSADRLLDLVADVTTIVHEAGYKGLLVLLDEPEVAAKKLGNETVQHFLFNLANELMQRKGNYGVFVSMPRNFFANAQARFAALPARLEARKCFPRLGDIYGPTFAQDLWDRYVAEFDLGEEGQKVVTPLTLQAIGDVGASDHSELSYGPRSVVSAFRRMVDHYQSTSQPYEPAHFVQDALDQEIMLKPEYRSRILTVLRSPDATDENRHAITFLAAFPSGLKTETLRELDLEDTLRPLSRAGGLIYRTASTMGLRALRTAEGGETEPLRELIEDIDSEYAPDRRAFHNALSAFARDVVPMIFSKRQGQQLVGWQSLHPLRQMNPEVCLGTLQGAFQQTERRFPSRAVIVMVSSLGASLDEISIPPLGSESGPQGYDLVFHFDLRWHADQAAPARVAELREDPDGLKPARIHLCLDLSHGILNLEHLAEMVGADRLTPLWALNLLERMHNLEALPREVEAEWTTLRDMILRQVSGLLLGEDLSDALSQAAKEELDETLAGSAIVLIGSATDLLLSRRYPDYATLIRQPQWQGKVDTYTNALSSREVPLACKRGREPWKPEGEVASRVLKTTRMNLTGGAFEGFEHLLEVESKGRNTPIEITFHIHPLEDEIRELITSQPTGAERKLKRQGKECWYIPISDLLPVILQEGYTVEELQKIIEIGKTRQSYDVTELRGERVIYSVPLDPEEMKAQLRAKMADLVTEIGEYRLLPDYRTRFDPADMEKSIDDVEDDADYDKLTTRLNKEFEQNHSRLPGYFDRVQEKLQTVRNQVKGIGDQLSGAREISQLTLPKATSPWGSALGRYIVPNLEQTVDTLRKQSKGLLKTIDQDVMRLSFSRQRLPQENLALLQDGWSQANDIESNANSLCQSTRDLMLKAADFGKWCSLLSLSDQVYQRLLELKKDAGHQVRVEELIGAFDKISEEIADHIELRNVAALADHKQFLRRFEELDVARQKHLTGLKSSFDKCKERVNQFLSTLNIDGRAQAVFNPLDIANCYDELFSQGAELVAQQALDLALAEMARQERELQYACNILRAIEPEAVSPLATNLRERGQALLALKDEVTPDWLRGLIENEDQAEMGRLANQMDAAFQAARQVRKEVQKISAPAEPSSGQAREMYDLIPEQRAIDLKDVVLQMMSQVSDPSQVLDASLESLADLFRRNCVQISVERRQR